MSNVVLQRDDLRVTVRDAAGRVYVELPAVGVAARNTFEDWPLPSDGPPGDGALYVLLVRLPYTPDNPEGA